MTNLIKLNANDIINVRNNELTTTSLQVAEVFNKKHKNILRKIDEILTQVSDSFGKLNFKPTEYEIKNNIGATVKYRAFNITKDGFVLLVMGFTGKLAMQIKVAYIDAFNFMADKLYGENHIDRPSTGDDRVGLRQAISKLVSTKGLLYPDAYNMVNQRFNKKHIDQFKLSELPEAVQYVHELTVSNLIEGELMPREPVQEKHYINKNKKNRLAGITLMKYGSLARMHQDEELRKLDKMLTETQDQLKKAMQYNGALYDGFSEAWFQLSFAPEECREACKRANEWFKEKYSE